MALPSQTVGALACGSLGDWQCPCCRSRFLKGGRRDQSGADQSGAWPLRANWPRNPGRSFGASWRASRAAVPPQRARMGARLRPTPPAPTRHVRRSPAAASRSTSTPPSMRRWRRLTFAAELVTEWRQRRGVGAPGWDTGERTGSCRGSSSRAVATGSVRRTVQAALFSALVSSPPFKESAPAARARPVAQRPAGQRSRGLGG